jgi:hypothetical protein
MSRFWPHFFLLSILEGLAALAALFVIPGEGLSLARLALFVIILLPLAASGWLFVRSLNADWRAHHLEPTAHPKLFRALTIFCSLLFLTSGLLLFLLRYLNPEATATYFVRARPALTYLLLLAAQTVLWLTALRNGIHLQSAWTRRAVFVSAGIVFAVFLVIWLVIIFTGLGITKDTSYWGEPGVPHPRLASVPCAFDRSSFIFDLAKRSFIFSLTFYLPPPLPHLAPRHPLVDERPAQLAPQQFLRAHPAAV